MRILYMGTGLRGFSTSGSMEELKEYADKMQSIVALISSVASQTSLLALNASIEAARQ